MVNYDVGQNEGQPRADSYLLMSQGCAIDDILKNAQVSTVNES